MGLLLRIEWERRTLVDTEDVEFTEEDFADVR